LTYAGNVLGETVICPAEHPTWSPNGTKIAFAAYPGWPDFDAKEQIYVMNADGSGKVQLTSETGAHCRWPSWSPDGSKIVFQKDYPGFYNTTEIWIMNADGSGAKALTDRNVTFDGWPSFIKKPL
jgi:TolB protein